MDLEGLAACGAGCDGFAVGIFDIWPALWMFLYHQWLYVNKNAIDVDQKLQRRRQRITADPAQRARSRDINLTCIHHFVPNFIIALYMKYM